MSGGVYARQSSCVHVVITPYTDHSEDLSDQDNKLLLRVLRERVRQMCASSFNDNAMVCTYCIVSRAGSFTGFQRALVILHTL